MRFSVASAGFAIVLGAVFVAGCGQEAPGSPDGEVPLSRLQAKQHFHEGSYLGRPVTVHGTVREVRNERTFKLAGANPDNESVQVVTDRPVRVAAGQVVRVRATVGQLHRSAPSDKEPYIQQDLYDERATAPYLYHAALTG